MKESLGTYFDRLEKADQVGFFQFSAAVLFTKIHIFIQEGDDKLWRIPDVFHEILEVQEAPTKAHHNASGQLPELVFTNFVIEFYNLETEVNQIHEQPLPKTVDKLFKVFKRIQ